MERLTFPYKKKKKKKNLCGVKTRKNCLKGVGT